MNQKEARSLGFSNGAGATTHCEVNESDMNEAGCEHEGNALCANCLSHAAHDAEMGARDFSPFEHIASAFNNAERADGKFQTEDARQVRSEGLWDAYDDGVAAGINYESKRRLKREGHNVHNNE